MSNDSKLTPSEQALEEWIKTTYGATLYLTGDWRKAFRAGWCAALEHVSTLDAKDVKKVECDNPNCEALDQPETLEEYKIAYEHWRKHSYLSGCSHAR